MNGGQFDGGLLSVAEKDLRDFYVRLLNFTQTSPALAGEYREIHSHNRQFTEWYNDKVFSFVRWSEGQKLVIVANYSASETYGFELQLPEDLVKVWGLQDRDYPMAEKLYGKANATLKVNSGKATVRVDLAPLESWVLEVR